MDRTHTESLVAEAVLAGPLSEAAILEALTLLRGRGGAKLARLAREIATRYRSGPRPRNEELTAFLATVRSFDRLFPTGSLRFADLPPRSMQPAGGAPETWAVPALTSVRDLAEFLHLSQDEVHALARSDWSATPTPLGRAAHYHARWIPRRGRLPRLVEAPKLQLKAAQRRILHGILALVPAHDAAHGFVRGRGTRTAAAPHAGKHCVLRMDVTDFFVSLRRARVAGMFRALGYPEVVAATLAALCTTKTANGTLHAGLGSEPGGAAGTLRAKLAAHHLPQGAPTSPALANLCAFALDTRLRGLATRFRATYTRYADDLVFSGDGEFARGAARCAERVAAILADEGLAASTAKTRIMARGVSQRVAGLVVNAAPAVPRRERDLLEAILTNCVRRGPMTQNRERHPHFREHLAGRIAVVAQHAPHQARRLHALFARIAWDAPPPPA